MEAPMAPICSRSPVGTSKFLAPRATRRRPEEEGQIYSPWKREYKHHHHVQPIRHVAVTGAPTTSDCGRTLAIRRRPRGKRWPQSSRTAAAAATTTAARAINVRLLVLVLAGALLLPPSGAFGDLTSQRGAAVADLSSSPSNSAANGSGQSVRLVRAAAATAGSGARPSLSLAHVSEADLLPLSEFVVGQPAFGDIMRTWPPTTSRQATRPPTNRQQHQQQHHKTSAQRPANRPGFFERMGAHLGAGAGDEQLAIRNHLNEDFDDSIVTADESFEQDQLAEPPTWVNYLGELGDHIYLLLRQFYEPQNGHSPFMLAPNSNSNSNLQSNISTNANATFSANQLLARRIETVADSLDDFYYDQYENNQVLYYGPQLVREGDTLEIGCYLPLEQPAEWTKSGRLLAPAASASDSNSTTFALGNPLRVIKRSTYMGVKQNFSLKIFEAQMSDTGNYRCNRLSRKYHKLLVVPARANLQQLYLAQQRLLAVVAPQHQAAGQLTTAQLQALQTRPQTTSRLANANQQAPSDAARTRHNSRNSSTASASGLPTSSQPFIPGHVLVEGQPLLVNCNITDELILRRLREMAHFQLAWYKNGKLMRNSQMPATSSSSSSSSQSQQVGNSSQQLYLGRAGHHSPGGGSNQRIQFLGPNGRQMYISAANYADAADYLCSWSRLPVRQEDEETDEQDSSATSAGQLAAAASSMVPPTVGQLSANPLAAGNLHQLVAPVKLRPFKSAYHVREHSQLRLVCQIQRGYPAAQVNWYVGNQLVDGDFLRANPEFRLLQLEARAAGRQLALLASANQEPLVEASSAAAQQSAPETNGQIVEINPVPAGRQQMALTANGRGQWVEYKRAGGERQALDTAENQLKYLQTKLAQLTGASAAATAARTNTIAAGAEQPSGSATLASQASLSVLIVSRLEREKHTSRYACRATSRANTDEVTTVIRVKELATMVVRPHGGSATLQPGQPLHFECAQLAHEHAEFKWYKRTLLPSDGKEETPGARVLLEPNTDDNVEIYNDRLTLVRPGYEAVGDYICQALDDAKGELEREYATIKVRAQPYIHDFGLTEETLSHTGKSATLTDGQRLELSCHIRDPTVPVNITWLRSEKPDDERQMVTLSESALGGEPSRSGDNEDELPLAGQPFVVPANLQVLRVDNFTRRLVIESVGPEHRGYYTCLVDNGVTERGRKTIFVRVKDKIVALWPFLGILAELFILFTIIYIWETQRAQKAFTQSKTAAKQEGAAQAAAAVTSAAANASKRPTYGPASAFENVPLNR